MTLNAWFNDWITTFNEHLKASTKALYRILYQKHVSTQFGGKMLSEMNPVLLQRFFNDIQASASMKHNLKAILSGMFKKALQIGLICSNPMQGVTIHAPIKRRIDYLSTAEQENFSEYVQNKHLGPLFLFISATGVRVGEALGVRWSDVDLRTQRLYIRRTVFVEGGKLHLQTPKTQQSFRSIYITDTLKQILVSLRFSEHFEAEGFLFANPKTKEPYRQNYICRLCRLYSEASINRAITPHVLRHTFATRAFEAGVDVKIISAILGHSGTQITYDTYVHASEKSIAQAMKQIESVRSGVM